MLEDDSNVTDEELEKFVELMFEMTMFMENIQNEIAQSLITDDKVLAMTEKAMKQPDHVITSQLTKAVHQFLLTMPVASMYGVNLMMNVIEHHSRITGNPAVSVICRKVQEKINAYNYN